MCESCHVATQEDGQDFSVFLTGKQLAGYSAASSIVESIVFRRVYFGRNRGYGGRHRAGECSAMCLMAYAVLEATVEESQIGDGAEGSSKHQG